MIVLKNISKSFGKKRIIFDLNLHIEKGEIVAIIGESGVGKTTLLNIMAMIDKPDSGDYFLNGKKVDFHDTNKNAKIRNHKIGYIFQDFRLIEEMSVLDNISVPMMIAGEKNIEKRRKELVKLFGISSFYETKIKKLSGGQKQRVAIARALAMNPDLIFADEPTGALDKKRGMEIMEYMKEMRDVGKTIVVVTHDAVVAAFCDRVIYM